MKSALLGNSEKMCCTLYTSSESAHVHAWELSHFLLCSFLPYIVNGQTVNTQMSDPAEYHYSTLHPLIIKGAGVGALFISTSMKATIYVYAPL